MLQLQKEVNLVKDPVSGKEYITLNTNMLRPSASISRQEFSMVSFLCDLGAHILDTYLIVLMA